MSFALVIKIPPPACVCVEGHVGSRVCLGCALGIDGLLFLEYCNVFWGDTKKEFEGVRVGFGNIL